MAAKKKIVQEYGSKTRFVMGLRHDMSAKEVVTRGKAKGIVLSESHVYKIRSVNNSKGDGVLRPEGTKKAAKPAKETAKPAKDTVRPLKKAVRPAKVPKPAKKVPKPAKKAPKPAKKAVKRTAGATKRKAR